MNFQYDLKNILTSALKYTFMSLINTDELGDCFCGFVLTCSDHLLGGHYTTKSQKQSWLLYYLLKQTYIL